MATFRSVPKSLSSVAAVSFLVLASPALALDTSDGAGLFAMTTTRSAVLEDCDCSSSFGANEYDGEMKSEAGSVEAPRHIVSPHLFATATIPQVSAAAPHQIEMVLTRVAEMLLPSKGGAELDLKPIVYGTSGLGIKIRGSL